MTGPTARRLGLGRLAYRLYHRPRAAVAAARRRGFAGALGDAYHHRAMRRAAAALPPVRPENGSDPLRVHFLTGRRFWHQTAFCGWSFARTAGVDLDPVIHDDGSLTRRQAAELRRIFPRASFVTPGAAEAKLDEHLPSSRYPLLRARRLTLPNFRKLTDVHAGESGWRLVLDSDMIFFRRPDALLGWFESPDRPCHMVDVDTAYGYPLDLLSRQCGFEMRDRVNVGVAGLRSDTIDWDTVEGWMKEQIDRVGPHYYQEQAVTAQLMSKGPCLVLDDRDYRVLPDEAEAKRPSAVMHHYVADSKVWYYRLGWRTAAGAPPAGPDGTPAGRGRAFPSTRRSPSDGSPS